MDLVKLTSAHLLSNHYNTRGLSCTANTRNGEELDKTCEKVAFGVESSFPDQDFLLLEQSMSIVEITCRLKRSIAKTEE